MQNSLKTRARRDDATCRQLAGVQDVNDVRDILASSLLEMLGVLPETEALANESAPEVLARFNCKTKFDGPTSLGIRDL